MLVQGGVDGAQLNRLGDVVPSRAGDSGSNYSVFFTEIFDPFINKPLWMSEYAKNITVEQVPFGAEASSYLNSNFFGASSNDKQGIFWAGGQDTSLNRVSIETGKTIVPISGWGTMASFDVFEIARAQMNGIPLEMATLDAVGTQWELNLNIVAHLGAYAGGNGYRGLLNRTDAALATITPATKAAGGKLWINTTTLALNATPAEILADVNAGESATAAASNFNIYPRRLLLDPVTYAILALPVNALGNISILTYLSQNSLCQAKNGVPLDIDTNRFLLGTTLGTAKGMTVPFNATGADQGSAGATNRAVFYTNDRQYVRMKATNPFALTVQYTGTNYNIPYVGQLPFGIEMVYANTLGYMSGI